MAGSDDTAIFGSFDGVVSVIGVIVGLLAGPASMIVAGAFGLAVASAVGMGAGEFLGDPDRRLGRSAVMAGATAVGTVLPILPFVVFSKRPAFLVSLLICLAICAVIGRTRAAESNKAKVRAYVETFSIFLFAALLTGVVTMITGATG
jgi:VIT1/CCC1 family predicted Fe2+/Mn2+ transporter